jgi:hypothetical protein
LNDIVEGMGEIVDDDEVEGLDDVEREALGIIDENEVIEY